MAFNRNSRIRKNDQTQQVFLDFAGLICLQIASMASLLQLPLPPPTTPLRRPFNPCQPSSFTLRRHEIACRAKNTDTSSDGESNFGAVEIGAAIGGLLACPVIGVSLYALKTTGCGLPPGPGGSIGAVEGVSYLVVAGIVGWSLYTKAKTGSGLPAGPYGLLGGAEGLSYLTALAIVVVFGIQFIGQGSLPGPLPTEQCFG